MTLPGPGWIFNTGSNRTNTDRVGERNGLQCKVHTFRARRAAGASESVSILMFADGGFGDTTGNLAGVALDNHHKPNGLDQVFLAVLQQYNYTNRGVATDDLVIFNGDLSYGQDWPLNCTTVASSDTVTHYALNTFVGLPHIPIRKTPFENLEFRALRCGNSFPGNQTCFSDRTACEQYVDPEWLHTATMSGLIPGKQYYYRVGERNGLQSKVHTFRARRAANVSESVSILMFADGGFGEAVPQCCR